MRLRRATALLLSFATAIAGSIATAASPAGGSPAGDQVVISEVYGGGGNSGATYTHDYIELFNPTDADICLDGWALQYFSAAGTSPVSPITNLTGRIPAGGYYLAQQAAGAAGTTPLPTPNVVGGNAMSATNGRVQLVAPSGTVDLVGYGSANTFETAPTPALNNTTAAIRNGGGAVDSDNNLADFSLGAPDPDNSPAIPCEDEPPPPPDGCDVAATHQIAEVQGSGATSPLVGQIVRIEGVVTGDFQAPGLVGGFYLQDDSPDADPATSDGVLVFDNSAPVAPGDRVLATGRVTEFRRSGDSLPGTVTELTSTSSVALCGTGTIAPTPLVLPFPTLEAPEALEGVLVEVPAGLTVTELFTWARFGEVAVSSGGRLYNPTNGQGGTAEENDRRRILLDDTRTGQNLPALAYLRTGRQIPRLGDTLAEGLTGVLTYEFDVYRVQPTEPVVDTVLLADTAGPRPAGPDEVGGDVQVAAFNTLNYFVTVDTAADQGAPGGNDEPRGADSDEELARQRDKLLPALVAIDADVLGLIEIENSSAGAIDDLLARLNALLPGTDDDYAAVVDPDLGFTPNAYGGTFGTDLIRVAIIYRPSVVTPVGPAVSSADEIHDRPPLAQAFELAGGSEAFSVVINHFKSKGSCPAPGTDPANDDLGQGCWNALRRQQAAAVLELITSAGLPNAAILGDLNAYSQEDPVLDLQAAGWANVSELTLPLPDRYSFVFEGEAGELDHALLPDGFVGRLTGADIWHVNSDEPAGIDYNTFNVGQAIDGDPIYTPDPFRSSDHDPLVFGLDLRQPPGAPTSVTATPGWSAATVSWAAPTSGGPPDSYVVRALVSGIEVASVTVAAPETTTAIGPLDYGVVHTIEVVAVNADGSSPAATTEVTPGRIPRGRFLTATGSCAVGGTREWTVTNRHAVAVGFEWASALPVATGTGVVAAGGTTQVTVPASSFPVGFLVLTSGDRIAGAGIAFPC